MRVGKIETDLSNCRLVLMMGLPYSGKTTEAHKLGLPVVNPDAIRVQHHGRRYWGPAEPAVWLKAREQVEALFLGGHRTVVLDACSVTRRRRDEWRQRVAWSVEVLEVPTDPEECRRRILEAGDTEMIQHLERMAENYEPPQADEVQYGPATGVRRISSEVLEDMTTGRAS